MAHAVSQPRAYFFDGLDRIVPILRRIGQAIEAQSQGHARLARVHALQAKTDAELAQMGLRRDDIITHVFLMHSDI